MNLKQRIEAKEKKLGELRSELRELKRQYLEEKSGFKEGDLVERHGVKGVLCHGVHDGEVGGWYWRKVKKDGTLVNNRTWCDYDGSDLKKVESPQ